MSFLKRRFFGNILQTSERDPERDALLPGNEASVSTRECSDTDNGWAWLVALGLSIINFMVLGMARMNSMLFVDFMDVFKVDRKTAAVPYSLQQAGAGLFGPVAGFLGQRFGIAAINILGALAASVGCAGCYFAKDMKLINGLWGGMFGLGIALTGPVKLILLDQYFVKYKSSASGFVFAGASVGAILFPIAFQPIFQKHGFQDMFLLMGSIILHIIPIAMLLREKPKSETEFVQKTKESVPTNTNYGSFPETGASPESELKHNPPSNSDIVNPEMASEDELEKSVPSTSQELNSSERPDDELKSPRTKELKDITSKPTKHMNRHRNKPINSHHTSSKAFANGDNQIVSVKFTESINYDSYNELSVEMTSNTNYSQDPQTSIVSVISKDYSGDFRKYSLDTLSTEKARESENVLESSKKEFKSSFKRENQGKENFGNMSEKKDSGLKTNQESKHDVNNHLIKEKIKPLLSYKNAVNFKILHENSDLLFFLFSDKIPLIDEELISSTSEITQCNLEFADLELILNEFQKIENHLQRPNVEVQQYLEEIEEKSRNFCDLLNADRKQFLKQRNLNIEGTKLAYKDIRSTKIRKSDCIFDVIEYSLEVPLELYIPIKLQELSNRAIACIVWQNSRDETILEVLKQLKTLHEIFSTSTYTAKDSSQKDLLYHKPYCKTSKSLTNKNKKEFQNTFLNQISIALKVHINPMFLIVSLSRGLFAITFLPVVTSVVDFSRDHGMQKSQGLYSIAVLYAGDLIGRLCTGWITDKGFISEKNYMVIALMLLGVSTATLPFLSGIAMLLPALGIFALLEGSLFMKHPTMCMKYLTKQEMYIGLGFMNFFAGIMALINPYYIGYFRDYLGSYDKLLYINGGLSVFVGCLWIMEPFLTRFVPAYKEKLYTATPFSIQSSDDVNIV